MKYIAFIAFTLCLSFSNAQTNIHKRISRYLSETTPGMQLNDKLLFLSFSKNYDEYNTRQFNEELNRCSSIYAYARLKGGLKGVNSIIINQQENISPIILIQKLNLNSLYMINASEIDTKDLSSQHIENILFDSNGNIIATNLTKDDLFITFNSLITR